MMSGAILSFITGLLGKLLGGLFGHKELSAADLADSNARAQEQLHQEKASNEILTKAADARADADARIERMPIGTGNIVSSDPDAAINRDIDGHYRD